jgi:hypothetical protein
VVVQPAVESLACLAALLSELLLLLQLLLLLTWPPASFDACSNKDVVPIDFIDACSVGERLTLFANISSLTIMSAFAVCLIFGELDPLGEEMATPLQQPESIQCLHTHAAATAV